MKQLFINGNATTLFFNSSSTFDDVYKWIEKEVWTNERNPFNLNERTSCGVFKNAPEREIWVSGDSDDVTLTFVLITPINVQHKMEVAENP